MADAGRKWPGRVVNGKPMICRWVGVLFALTLLLVGGSVVIAHATSTDDPHCLVLADPIHDTGQFDLRTDVGLNITAIPRRFQQRATQAAMDFHQIEFSADQKHFAYSIFNSTTHQAQLFIKRTDQPGFAPGTLMPAPVGKDSYDFAWSADSRWLAFWWESADQSFYLGIADTAGNIQHVKAIPVQNPTDSTVMLLDWSGDGLYFALATRDKQTNSDSLLFWSAPDLQLIQTVQFANPPFLPPSFGPQQLLGVWSPEGHQFAYWRLDDVTKELQLVLVTPGENPTYFHFPKALILSAKALNNFLGPDWSPDGRYLFTEYILNAEDNGLVPRNELTLIDTDTKTVQSLSDNAIYSALDSAFWSDDGQYLYFMQMDDQSELVRRDLMRFRVGADRPDLMVPGLDLNFTYFVTQNIFLFRQPGADADNIIGLWRNFAQLQTVGSFKNAISPTLTTASWRVDSENDWAIFTDLPRTVLFAINVRTGVQKSYNEPNSSDTNTNILLNKQWLSEIKLGPPVLLKLLNLDDGTEREIPLPADIPGLILSTTSAWSSDGNHVAIASINSAHTSTATIDIVDVADGHIDHIRKVSPIYNPTLYFSMDFSPCR